ncbi:conjugal transfer protein TrbE, partial [Neisseria gonorrhoeae]
AVADLEKYRKKWKQKVRGFFDQVFNTHSGSIDQDAQAMVDDAEAALAETKSGLVAQGYYTSVVILMHEDRAFLESMARQVEKEINTLGFNARVETVNTMEAWLGSLPGHGIENVRRPLLNTLNFADMIPTSSIWTGLEEDPCQFYPPNSPPLMQVVTSGSSPFRLGLHVGDVGHTLVFGPTGAGKSTLLATLAAQADRYRNMRVFSFDKGR